MRACPLARDMSVSVFVPSLTLAAPLLRWYRQGLILGSTLWYPFYDCEDEDDVAFEKRLMPLKRAIGERGKAEAKSSTEEGVPPLPSPTSASAAPKRTLSAAVARPPAPAPAPAAVPRTPRAQEGLAQPVRDLGFSPSMQGPVTPSATSTATAVVPLQSTVGAPGMGIDSAVIAFMREERDFMAAKMKEQKEELERQRKEMEAKLSPAVAISGEQLIRVQARLEKLHAANK